MSQATAYACSIVSRAQRRCAPAGADSRLGPWRLNEPLGEGSFCRVYAASFDGRESSDLMGCHCCHASGEPAADYAVKTLTDRWVGDPWATQLLQREALIAGRVQHPHVVSVLSFDVTAPRPYLVMPRLRGTSLAERMSGGRGVEVPEALWIARQAAEGLAALHAAGWVHADVKPSNVFVSDDGHVTLMDLGLAALATDSVPERVRGSWKYLAPEWVSIEGRPGPASDLYSLGVILYEMLAGHHPFAAEEGLEYIREHHRTVARELHRVAPRIPVAVSHLVRKLLAKDPLRRPQEAAELAKDLARAEIATFDLRWS